MDSQDLQKQRLKNKASSYKDIKKNKKDNAQKSQGSFDFSSTSTGDSTPEKKKKNHTTRKIAKRTWKILTSKFGVAAITALTVSSIFLAQNKADDIQQQDNLDPRAVGLDSREVGGKVHDEPENKKVFPNPPSPEEDTLSPSNVGQRGMEVDPKTSLAIGDSTVAWANKEKIDNTISGCDNEKNTWADDLNIKTLACPGYTTRQIAQLIKEHKKEVKEAKTIFLTAGSNDIRGDKVGDLDYGVEDIVSTIQDINPKSHIIFVGYLPVYIDDVCMDTKDRNSARRLYDFHRKANYALQDAALRHNYSYIDVFHSPFEVCNKDHAYVRIPRHGTPGAWWHTTEEGHKKVTQSINSFVTWKKS